MPPPFLLEARVTCAVGEEVAEGCIQMAQGLLQGNAGDLGEPGGLRLLFEICQCGRCVLIREVFLSYQDTSARMWSAQLKTNRAQPNVRASMAACAGVG